MTHAMLFGSPEFAPWAGFDTPSLEAKVDNDSNGDVEFDVPNYDLRKLMTARDSLCGVDAYNIAVRVVAAHLYGLRMCPRCPDCALSENPCMDIFGSNATPMGGSAGRADALVGATEAQKAEGVLHLHFFIYIQMAHQHLNLNEIAELFRKRLLSLPELKKYHDHVRCASYPDVEGFQAAKADIEKVWPHYAADTQLCRAPAYVWTSFLRGGRAPCPSVADIDGTVSFDDWLSEGAVWKHQRDARLQHVLSRMNYHIHPMDAATGERRPLRSCQPKNRPKECKSGFPLDDEMTEHAILVCPCIAKRRGLARSGPRSKVGSILSARNDPWLNAAPSI